MQRYCFTLKPRTAFGTPIVGDTLFGQICWTLRYQLGNSRLEELLVGYTEELPFLIVSDAFPLGYIPLPHFPKIFWENDEDLDRKILKSRRWVAIQNLKEPVKQWQKKALSDQDILQNNRWSIQKEQPHNTINRISGTTGIGMFAPYTQSQIWYDKEIFLQCYILLDENRLSLAELINAFKTVGETGYGRDASIGLGKFDLLEPEIMELATSGKLCMTLASCAPQGLEWIAKESYYQVQTRFGRHGDVLARGKNPFKRPLLMVKTGSVFAFNKECHKSWFGQGVNEISFADSSTVHQGYAPVIYLS